ncbi:MAG: ABC transporter permease [Candidatus Sulfotelmatobacter sp.]
MRQLMRALRIEIRLGFVKMVRYPLQTLTSMLVLYLLFIGMFYGSKFLAGTGIGAPVDHSRNAVDAIAAYLLWFLSLFAIDSMSQSISEEAQTGTLEQLYLSRWNLPLMLFMRFVATLLVSVAMLLPLLGLMTISTGVSMGLRLAESLPLILLTSVGLCGMGYMLGAVTLIFKRIGNAMTLVQFGLLFLCLPPVEQLPRLLRYFALALPLTQGVKLLRSAMSGAGVRSVLAGVGFLAVTSLTYVIAGLAVFHWSEDTARARGLLGHY